MRHAGAIVGWCAFVIVAWMVLESANILADVNQLTVVKHLTVVIRPLGRE